MGSKRPVSREFLAGTAPGGDTVWMRVLLKGPTIVTLAVLALAVGLAVRTLDAEPPLASDPAVPVTPETGSSGTSEAAEIEVVDAGKSTSDATEDASEAAKPSRVYLWVDRYEELAAVVVEEDRDLISVRDLDGNIRSFPKARLHRIIRLNDVEEPRPGLVELRDGTILAGDLVRDDFDQVVIRIEGVNTRLPRASVVQTRLDLSTPEKYRRFRDGLADDQYLRRYELAAWLFEEEAYELARDELADLVLSSKLPQALDLLRLVEAQLLLEADSAASNSPSPMDGRTLRDERGTGPVDLRDLLPKEILSKEDVNTIRVYEIDFRDPPRMFISPDSIREILEKYGSSPLIPADSAGRTSMFRAPPEEIVELLFKLKARDLYSRIEVGSEPAALNLFRRRVHDAWLIPNCATSRCHGGLDGGRFFLHRRNSKSERVRYTNLMILERWNELEMPLLDYLDPGRSLLIQYGLPRNEARFPHPEVKGWKPVFGRGNPRLLRDAFTWLNSMYRPRTTYPVDFEAPVIETPTLPEPDSPDRVDDRRGR